MRKSKYSEEQIQTARARTSWGNKARQVDAEQVKAQR